MSHTITISSLEILDQLKRQMPSLLPRHERISLDIPVLEQTERCEWEDKLTRYYCACGCGTGAAALLLTLLGIVGYGLFALLSGSQVYLQTLLVLFCVLLSSPLIGKALGLVYAILRFRQTCNDLRARLTCVVSQA